MKAAKVSYCRFIILLCVCLCVKVMSLCNSVNLCTVVCMCEHVARVQALTDELECDTSG